MCRGRTGKRPGGVRLIRHLQLSNGARSAGEHGCSDGRRRRLLRTGGPLPSSLTRQLGGQVGTPHSGAVWRPEARGPALRSGRRNFFPGNRVPTGALPGIGGAGRRRDRRGMARSPGRLPATPRRTQVWISAAAFGRSCSRRPSVPVGRGHATGDPPLAPGGEVLSASPRT